MSGKDEATGRFLPGNRFWEARSSHGRSPKFESADDLWDACVQYFDWVDENPLHGAKAFAYEGDVTIEAVPKMRAMTLRGLCLFIDVTQEAWRTWKTADHEHYRADLVGVITRAEGVIYEQKFTGAAADLLNANIIARELGLSDKTELTGKDGGPIKTETRTWREVLRQQNGG